MSVVGDLIRKVEEELETYRVHDKHEARNIDASVPDHGMPRMDEENSIRERPESFMRSSRRRKNRSDMTVWRFRRSIYRKERDPGTSGLRFQCRRIMRIIQIR